MTDSWRTLLKLGRRKWGWWNLFDHSVISAKRPSWMETATHGDKRAGGHLQKIFTCSGIVTRRKQTRQGTLLERARECIACSSGKFEHFTACGHVGRFRRGITSLEATGDIIGLIGGTATKVCELGSGVFG